MNHGARILHLRGAAGMDAIYRKISWRLLPLLMLCYAVAYLDRVNVSYAKLQMGADLDFSNQVYAWGAGIFFIGYCLFEVPSNLLLEKIGARKTLLRIMLCWGFTAAAGAFVREAVEFYVIRFLLGVFEAGFFPGVILYLTYWFPSARRARVIAIFASAALMAGVVAGPLCGATLQYMNQYSGLSGWQWLLVLQGLPAVVLGIVAYFYLDDKPQDARWLSSFEQQMIEQDLERDEQALNGDASEEEEDPSAFATIWSLLREPSIALLALSNLLLMGASYALVFWSPTLMQRWGAGDPMQLGLLAAIPNLAGVIGMVVIGWDSDRRRERRGHFIACMVLAVGGLGLAIAADHQLLLSVAGLSLAATGIAASSPLLVSILTTLLNRRRAATGIALVGSFGLLGGAFGPPLSERMLAWGDSAAMLAAMIVLYLAAGAILLWALRLAPRRGGPSAGHGQTDKMARS
ncbi:MULTISPECIES: MFS transporter [unclassified Duganella]|uniref:MFS transporter n=1 Tax=unclassified Duganella TaxID=2636909 RepID=UPI0008825D19|nr:MULTISPECIES: MFS transporter [unclassified Duganella]SDH15040.1 Sugar phosphate permease [Duganella sp. OV458]SDK29554.1 Sugar phosphate permease [Duganella sp. OV510]